MSLLQQASGGSEYDARFGVRQRGQGPYAAMIDRRFKTACRRLGLNAKRQRETLECGRYQPPGQRQMSLGFD